MTDQSGPRVGLCGWTIAMSSYVRRFPLVEVQHTFYEPPTDPVLQRWRLQAPTRFEFTIKAWQLVTHESSSPTWKRTLACARLLRATAVLLQCPKSFRPTGENVSRMRAFLSTVERPDARLLWEPRGDWPASLVSELCLDLDLAHVVDPMQTETVTPDQTYYRLHGTTGARHVHTDQELRRVRALIDGRPTPYVMFNNLPRVGDAQRFLDLL